MSQHLWEWIAVASMVLGTVPPLLQLTSDREHWRYYAVLVGITGVAAVAYSGMAVGIGTLVTNGREWEPLRYLDWVLTTPLIVLYLAMLLKPGRSAYLQLVAVDLVVILSGVAAIVLTGPARLAAFGVGAVAFVALAYLLYRRVPALSAVDSIERRAVFEKLRNLTVVLWSVYPLVWLLSTKGFGLLLPGTEAIITVYLDVLTKVAFVVIAVNGSDVLARTGVASLDEAMGAD